MSWLLLVIAGVLEIVWAVGLKYTQGFSRPLPSTIVAVALAASIAFLSLATRHLPIGTAYAIWVGIGALGAAVGGIVLFGETVTAPRLLFLGLLLVSVVGLKLTTN
jgi:quaternary ammonium compound-resistance protein SugE